MREIKFRAWDSKNGIMLTVSELRLYNTENAHIFVINRGWIDAGKGVVMQYTGLKDKNGQEIYEGDLIRWGDSEQGEIRWIGLNTAFNTLAFSGGWLCFVPPICEVIGNIYENPEMAKGEI